MRRLKIALYTTTFPPKLGGIATSNYNIYNLLKDHHDLKVFVYNDAEPAKNEHVVVSRVPSWLLAIYRFFVRLYLKKYKSSTHLKVTEQNLIFALHMFTLNKRLQRYQPDLILIADNGLPAYALKKPLQSKLIWFAHNNYYRFNNRVLCPSIGITDLQIACSMERKAITKADAVVSPSEYMVGVCREAFQLNVPLFVNRNIILKKVIKDIDAVDLKARLQMPTDFPLVYIPSAGSPIKGKRYIYEIVRQLIRHTNNAIGFYLSGPIPPDLVYELNLLKQAHIHIPGHLTWHENVASMKTCDLCITPNLIENYSNALLEAQTLSIPVIAFDTGGNKEIVADGETGSIVPYLDIYALIETSKILLSDEALRYQYAKNCKAHIAVIADEEHILKQYHNIFNAVMNETD